MNLINGLEKLKARLTPQVTALLDELDELTTKVAALRDELKALTAKRVALEGENERLDSEIATKRPRLTELGM
jgi:predicted nuclease with TOPRIM domain